MTAVEPEALVRDLLEHVIEALGLDAELEVKTGDETILATLEGEDLGLFIGRHGQTIDAVQHLAQRVVIAEGEGPRIRVIVDAAGYRARREEALHQQADEAADEALSSGGEVALEPMSPAERKLVHTYLAERGDVTTHSEGNEPERRLVVSPA